MFNSPEPRRRGGRHRARNQQGPAAAVTAGIAAGSLALAAYAATSAAAPRGAEQARASFADRAPALGAKLTEAGQAQIEARQMREKQGADALALSTDLTTTGVSTLKDASAAISQRAQAERDAEAAAAAAEREAAERSGEEEAGSRSSERAAPTEPAASEPAPSEPAPSEPEPSTPPATGDPRSTARSMLSSHGWADDQWGCLDALWERESNWNPSAMNASSGAYGIPQALPGTKMASAGSDWQTNPTTQITWGLGYISERYGSPCGAWAHSQSVGWY